MCVFSDEIDNYELDHGTILTDKWILTSATVCRKFATFMNKEYFIIGGAQNLTNKEYFDQNRVPIKNYFTHPGTVILHKMGCLYCNAKQKSINFTVSLFRNHCFV